MSGTPDNTAHCLPKKGLRQGAPRLYSPKIVNKICDLIIKGESTNKICQRRGYPSRVTFGKWLRKYPEFYKAFHEAKQIQTYFNIDDIREIADEADDTTAPAVMKAKLRVDTMKWEAGKLLPRIYGDKASLEVQHTEGVDMGRMEEIIQKVIEKTQPLKITEVEVVEETDNAP